MTVACYGFVKFESIHRSGVLTELFGCHMAGATEAAAVSAHVLCAPYNQEPAYSATSFKARVHVCLAVTYHLHFWQDYLDLLSATEITRHETDTEMRISTEN